MSFRREGPFRIYKASQDHIVGRRKVSGYPLFLGTHGVFEPVQAYLRYRRVTRNRSNGTVHNDALILRHWLEWLERGQLTWTEASNQLFEEYVSDRLKAVSASRVQAELGVIFGFYWVAQEKLGLVHGLVEHPNRGEIGQLYPISCEISHKVGKDGARVRRLSPQVSLGTLPTGSLRPTPNDEQVEQILDALLGGSKCGRGPTWWLMAKWMHRSTLRCAGVASLSVGALGQALFNEGISDGRSPYELPALSSKSSAQDRIKLELSRLASRGRTALHVGVVEKRQKARVVPVPIDIFELNLDYIWSDRDADVAMLALRPTFVGTDALFPSLKSGTHFQPKSISNLINARFAELGIRGSAHRIRAACCMHYMRERYLRARAIHGRAWDPNAVLMEVAELMGHSDPESLRPYLTRVEKEEELIDGEALVVPHGSSDLIRGLASALEMDVDLQRRLVTFLEEEGIVPAARAPALDALRASLRPRRGSSPDTFTPIG